MTIAFIIKAIVVIATAIAYFFMNLILCTFVTAAALYATGNPLHVRAANEMIIAVISPFVLIAAVLYWIASKIYFFVRDLFRGFHDDLMDIIKSTKCYQEWYFNNLRIYEVYQLPQFKT